MTPILFVDREPIVGEEPMRATCFGHGHALDGRQAVPGERGLG